MFFFVSQTNLPMANQFGSFIIHKECKFTSARISTLHLRTSASLPTFMPVATKAAMKGILSKTLNEQIILSNTYHCRNLENLSDFMGYSRAMLTDSGGFQIVSLQGTSVTEAGVTFFDASTNNSEKILLTPEGSMEIQNRLGADIIMQLDDVVNPLNEREKVSVAMERSLRWLKRCYEGHKRDNQLLFPIVQGGLHKDLRKSSVDKILEYAPKGIAIGGLSGGEDKSDFIEIVKYTIECLPKHIPRYVMGIGYPEDLIACVAVGADMADCVYPTRTGRFGRALMDEGDINLMKDVYKNDMGPLVSGCECFSCVKHTRAFIHSLKGTTNFCILLTIHNLQYMKDLMDRIKQSIMEDNFDVFVRTWSRKRFKGAVPTWFSKVFQDFGIKL